MAVSERHGRLMPTSDVPETGVHAWGHRRVRSLKGSHYGSTHLLRESRHPCSVMIVPLSGHRSLVALRPHEQLRNSVVCRAGRPTVRHGVEVVLRLFGHSERFTDGSDDGRLGAAVAIIGEQRSAVDRRGRVVIVIDDARFVVRPPSVLDVS